MKKISISFLAIVITAASANAQLSYGVHGSLIGSDLNIKTDDPANTGGLEKLATTRASFRAGFVASIPVGENFAFMPQLNFVSAGTKVDGTATLTVGGNSFKYTVKGNIKPTFIELPLNFVYKKELGNGSHFFAGVGPSLAFGIGGKSKVTVSTAGDPDDVQDSKIKFDGKANATDDNIHYKRLNLGGNAIAGYQMANGLFFQANFNYGFSNLSPDKGETVKTQYLAIGVGYWIGK